MEHYGNGKSAGLEQTVSESIQTGFTAADLEIHPDEKGVLKELAERVAGLAALPIMNEKRALWRKHNRLEKTRPIIFCDPENGWNEIFPPESLLCNSELARHWEFELRIKEFYGARMRDDRVIDARFTLRPVAEETGWGLQTPIIGKGEGKAFTWDPPLKDLNDLSGLRVPGATVDREATARLKAFAEELFEGVLAVDVKGVWWWSLGMTQRLVFLRGLERMMLDMLENPEGFHRLMAFMRDAQLARLDQLEADGLLCLNNGNDYVGSGGFGFTDELPAPGYNPEKPRTRDVWMFGLAQMFATVSPDMFKEFEVDYASRICARFGLVYYGCCDPLDGKMAEVRLLPNVRKVSMSPWVDQERGAREIGGDYVFSRKPSPALVATERFHPDQVRADLEATRTACDKHGCPLEFILKDISTVCYEPERLEEWARIAMQVAGA